MSLLRIKLSSLPNKNQWETVHSLNWWIQSQTDPLKHFWCYCHKICMSANCWRSRSMTCRKQPFHFENRVPIGSNLYYVIEPQSKISELTGGWWNSGRALSTFASKVSEFSTVRNLISGGTSLLQLEHLFTSHENSWHHKQLYSLQNL